MFSLIFEKEKSGREVKRKRERKQLMVMILRKNNKRNDLNFFVSNCQPITFVIIKIKEK